MDTMTHHTLLNWKVAACAVRARCVAPPGGVWADMWLETLPRTTSQLIMSSSSAQNNKQPSAALRDGIFPVQFVPGAAEPVRNLRHSRPVQFTQHCGNHSTTSQQGELMYLTVGQQQQHTFSHTLTLSHTLSHRLTWRGPDVHQQVRSLRGSFN